MHFWSGVSAIAGVLRRRVWIDMRRFVWFPNFYILFVAKPGIVSKTTTMNTAMDLLREVPGVKFGPKVITWQALVTSFANSCESFEFNGEYLPMSAITLASGELGNLIDPMDPKMMDTYITLWDGERKFDKVTKTSGEDIVEAPWINMIGCTTPSWIEQNMPRSAIGGGFTSRCIFVYADGKEKFVPWVDENVEEGDAGVRQALLQDLEHIALSLVGPFTITREARDWYSPVYEAHWKLAASRMDEAMAEGYAARKQTHMCKLAMVLSASRHDDMVIALEDLQLANSMLEVLEPDMARVFSKLGKSDGGIAQDRLLAVLKRHGELSYEDAYRILMVHFPDARNLENALATVIRAGYVSLDRGKNPPVLKYLGGFEG